MPHYGEQLGGSAQASQGVLVAQASSIAVVAANPRRIAVTLYAAGGPLYLGYGGTAVASVSMPIASGVLIEENSFKGQIQAVTGASGLTGPLFFTDVLLVP